MPVITVNLNEVDGADKKQQSVSEPVFTKTKTVWRFIFKASDDTAKDISSWLINFSAEKDGVEEWDESCSDVTDGTDGKCEATVSDSDITKEGSYTGELRWTKSGSSGDPEDGRQQYKFTVTKSGKNT